MINYIEKGSRPDIAYDVHKCTIFFYEPWYSYYDAIIHLCKYLQGNQDQSITTDPNKYPQQEVCADAYFIGN